MEKKKRKILVVMVAVLSIMGLLSCCDLHKHDQNYYPSDEDVLPDYVPVETQVSQVK